MSLMKKINNMKLFNKLKLNNLMSNKLIYIFLATIGVFLVYIFLTSNDSYNSYTIENFSKKNPDKQSHIAGSSCPLSSSYDGSWMGILKTEKGVELKKKYGMLPEVEVFKILSQDPNWNPTTQKPLKICNVKTGCAPFYKNDKECNSEKNFILKQCNESVGCGTTATCSGVNMQNIMGVNPNRIQTTKCICNEGYGVVDKGRGKEGCKKCDCNEEASLFIPEKMQRVCRPIAELGPRFQNIKKKYEDANISVCHLVEFLEKTFGIKEFSTIDKGSQKMIDETKAPWKSTTWDDKKCMKWNSDDDNEENVRWYYSDETSAGPKSWKHNLCRNPDNDPGGAWCWTHLEPNVPADGYGILKGDYCDERYTPPVDIQT